MHCHIASVNLLQDGKELSVRQQNVADGICDDVKRTMPERLV